MHFGIQVLIHLSMLAGAVQVGVTSEVSTPLSLELSDVSYDPTAGEVEFFLTNVGGRPVNAWGLHIHYHHEDGSISESSLLQDFAPSEGLRSPAAATQLHTEGALRPSQTHRGMLYAPAEATSPISDVSLFVRVVVYSDGAVKGDEKLKNEIVGGRRAAQLARSYWLSQFQHVLGEATNEEELAGRIADLRERLDSSSDLYSGQGVSSTNPAAQTQEQVILKYLEAAVQRADTTGDLFGALADLSQRLGEVRDRLEDRGVVVRQ